MTTWYTYIIRLPKGSLASAMAKTEEILYRQNWTYDRFLYHTVQSITGREPDCDKANAVLMAYYRSLGIPVDYFRIHRSFTPVVIFGNFDHRTCKILHNDPVFDQKVRTLLENPAFLRRSGCPMVIYQGINWRGRRADIVHDRFCYVDSILLYGGKYLNLDIVVDDMTDTADRIAAVFTEAFGHGYSDKTMHTSLTAEEQAMPLDFPELTFDFRCRGLYHPPSEDRSRTGNSARLSVALDRAGLSEHYTVKRGRDGIFLERRNERNHVMTVYLGLSRTGEIGVDGETLHRSATCNAKYEGINFTRMVFHMNSHLTTQRALDEFAAYSLGCIDRIFDKIQKYPITSLETPPWFSGFYSCY